MLLTDDCLEEGGEDSLAALAAARRRISRDGAEGRGLHAKRHALFDLGHVIDLPRVQVANCVHACRRVAAALATGAALGAGAAASHVGDGHRDLGVIEAERHRRHLVGTNLADSTQEVVRIAALVRIVFTHPKLNSVVARGVHINQPTFLEHLCEVRRGLLDVYPPLLGHEPAGDAIRRQHGPFDKQLQVVAALDDEA